MSALSNALLAGDREALAEKVHREERCQRRARRVRPPVEEEEPTPADERDEMPWDCWNGSEP